MGCRLGSGAYPGQTSDLETSARQEDHHSSHCHPQRMTSVYVDQNKPQAGQRNKSTYYYFKALGGSDSMLMLNQRYKTQQKSDTLSVWRSLLERPSEAALETPAAVTGVQDPENITNQ